MSDHSNVEIVRNQLADFSSGNMGGAAGAFADDIVWNMIGGEKLEGIDALRASFESMPSGEGVSFVAEPHDIIGNDDHVVALVEATVAMGDMSFSYRTAEIYHMSDGKITERWAFSDDTQRITDFFSQFDS